MSWSWRYRDDQPGDVQFLTMKGVGGLPIFALREDVRVLLSLMALEVRAGELRIFCFAFVRNHAHFLVLSPHGEIHRPLKRVLERFAVYYNRNRGRTGHVFKDRFHSACIRSDASLLCAVAYTDHNPVQAGLAEIPTAYEFGSASFFPQQRSPLWFDRRAVAGYVHGADGKTGQVSEESYLRVFGRIDFEFVKELIERRKYVEKGLSDPLDDFLAPDHSNRIDWILEQARQADGSAGARLLAKATTVKDAVERRAGRGDWKQRDGAAELIGWRTMLVGLLRLGSARSCRQVSALLQISPATVVRETRRHIERLTSNEAYLRTADEVLTEAVRLTFEFLPPFPSVGPGGETRATLAV